MSEKLTLKDLVRQEREQMAAEKSGGARPRDPAIAAVPTVANGDDVYVPPVTTVPLPSRGLVYGPNSALFDTPSLDVRAMTAKDENILTSPALIRKGKMLSALMRACVTNRSIDPDEMLVGDRNALMIAIRNVSYGPGYHATVACPKCGESAEYEFDLSKLSVKELEAEPEGGLGQNLFSFKFPTTGHTVRFRLLTAVLATELDQVLEGQRKAKGVGAVEENVTVGLAHQIVSLNGDDDRKRITRIVENLPVRDARALRSHIDKISPGVDMDQHMECAACGERSEVEVPITAEFFWPKERD